MPAVFSRKVKMPTLVSRRVLNEHVGRGPSGARLKDLYVTGLPGQGWLVQNFSGAMVLLPDPDLKACPFEVPLVEEVEVRSAEEIDALVSSEIDALGEDV